MKVCHDCGSELDESSFYIAFGDIYCSDCYSENFNTCYHCDELLHREETHWSDNGDPYCSECYENECECDNGCPDNPEVFDSDRKLILELSRNWLSGKSCTKTLLRINQKDFLLQKLRDITGLVDSTIYVFGLLDREEYQISASPNILEEVKELLLLNGLNAKVTEGIGCNRLGISYTLRKDNLPAISNLIKQLTRIKELTIV